VPSLMQTGLVARRCQLPLVASRARDADVIAAMARRPRQRHAALAHGPTTASSGRYPLIVGLASERIRLLASSSRARRVTTSPVSRTTGTYGRPLDETGSALGGIQAPDNQFQAGQLPAFQSTSTTVSTRNNQERGSRGCEHVPWCASDAQPPGSTTRQIDAVSHGDERTPQLSRERVLRAAPALLVVLPRKLTPVCCTWICSKEAREEMG
jgi:hypothetical protein